VLGTPSEGEAGVVSLRFSLTDGQPKTLDEIGKVDGVTRELIRQIESNTTPRLRHPSRPSPSGTTSTDLTDVRQPQDVTSHRARLGDAQNAQIRTASIVTGIEPYSAQIGRDCMRSPWLQGSLSVMSTVGLNAYRSGLNCPVAPRQKLLTAGSRTARHGFPQHGQF
jgi:hypothetical protein